MKRTSWTPSLLRRGLLSVAMVTVTAAAASSCSDGSTEPGGAITRVEVLVTPLSTKTTNMLRGTTIQLLAVPVNGDENFVNIPITWTSSDQTKATVDATGKVTTVAGGDVTISAAAGGQTGTFPINIQFPVGSVTVAPAAPSIRQEGSVTLTATLLGTDNKAAVGRTVAWSSSNTAVATVGASTGVVNGVTDGVVTITATSEGVSGTQTVTVNGSPLVSTVTVSPPATQSAFVAVGGTLQLTSASKAASGTTVAGTTTAWSTSSASIATVSATGLVTCVTAGAPTITATVDNGIGTNVTGTLAVTCATAAAIGANAVPGISSGSAFFYAIVVPAGTTNLTVQLSGGSGDPDLYLFNPTQIPGALTANGGFASPPAGQVSGNSGPSESVSIANPAAGTWRIGIHAWGGAGATAGTTMTVSRTP